MPGAAPAQDSFGHFMCQATSRSLTCPGKISRASWNENKASFTRAQEKKKARALALPWKKKYASEWTQANSMCPHCQSLLGMLLLLVEGWRRGCSLLCDTKIWCCLLVGRVACGCDFQGHHLDDFLPLTASLWSCLEIGKLVPWHRLLLPHSTCWEFSLTSFHPSSITQRACVQTVS